MTTDNIKSPTPNDYHFPALSRRDLMSLSTITKNDFPLKNIKNRLTSNRDWSMNLYNLDIEKAIPNRQSIYTHKIDYINKIDDIDKARPAKNTFIKPSYSLINRDIEKAYPRKQYRYTRQTNPLEPVYDFPKEVDPGPYEIPKFIRDTLDISDIDKARPKKSQMFELGIRSYNENIEKSQPRKPYVRKKFHDNFSYSDVYEKKSKVNRKTNPIWPDYGHYGGDIDKSHPQYSFNPYRLPGTLSCDDIRGTQPGTKNKSNLISTRHKAYSCEDIIGACQGSCDRGLKSNRVTNPLNPEYKYLGGAELAQDPRSINEDSNKPFLSRSQVLSNGISKNFFSIINNDKNKALDDHQGKGVKDNERYNNNSIGHRTNERYERAKDVNWEELPYYEEKPVFESSLYKRPDPYYPFKHHRELILTKTKPHTMDRKYGVYDGINNNNKSSASSFMEMNPNENNDSNSIGSIINGEKLDSKLNNAQTYEEQLSSFIKENSFH